MFIITIYALMLTANCLANPILDDEQQFRKYIQNIQSQIDDTIKPCANFSQYACGNMKAVEKNIIEKHTEQLIGPFLTDNEISQNDAQKMFRTFYLSCKNNVDNKAVLEQIDVLKSVKSWPVTRDFNADEIARLFGYLSTLESDELLNIDRRALSRHNSIRLTMNIRYNNNSLLSTLDKFGVSSEESLKTVENVSKFIEQLENSKTSVEQINDEFKDVVALKEAIPNFDWETYFTTFTNVFNFNLDDFAKKTVKTPNLENLKKTVDIIRETDSRTVANYLIWRFLDITSHINCEMAVEYFFPFFKYRNQSNSIKKIFMDELEVYNNFEKSYSTIKSQLNNPESDMMDEYLRMKKSFYENYEDFLTGQYLVKLFSEFEMNEKTLYSNIFNIMHAINKDLINNAGKEITVMLTDIVPLAISEFKELDNVHNSYLHNFIKVNTKLWSRTINYDDIFENRTISDKCLPYKNTSDTYKNMNYINYHAAYNLAFHDYLNYLDDHKDLFEKETEILTEAGLNYEKLYMLDLAQEKCLNSDTKDLSDDNLLWFFKHSKVFSDTWSCAAGDAMNEVCDDSSFVPKMSKSS